ncbi:head-tail connector protein [Phyllobacterium zundukense]|uniref:Phage gp6-like head-tail connector protein n=1 Tax=Phyllobacterium zundukense TaxID=1867719 RepID=A0A2N9W451_9HYPH|nr:head-tail connector protein [Phyllobacterium zundukense]ATU92011.1 hypothetical protein BLM14_10490 [Phyllobacterium zundukense]PIO46519.1 hypothetical protein B5P45_01590 [Phyllobacterium zundukense]
MSITPVSLLAAQLDLMGIDADPDLLQHKLNAAEAWIENFLGKPLSSFEPMPADLTEGVLQLAAHLHENRFAVLIGDSANELPFGLLDMIRPYREWVF